MKNETTMTDANTGLRQLADRLTDRYGTGKTIVDQVGDYYVSIYWHEYEAQVFSACGAYSLSLYRHGHPVYMSGDTDKKLYDLTYDDLIRKLDEYFPRVKAKQMEMEI